MAYFIFYFNVHFYKCTKAFFVLNIGPSDADAYIFQRIMGDISGTKILIRVVVF